MRVAWLFLFLAPLPALAQTNSDMPVVPNNAQPNYGVTFYIGFKENVDTPTMQQFATKMTNVNEKMWDVSHGAVRIYKCKFYKNITGNGSINNVGGLPKDIDIWVKPWTDEPANVGGYVYYQASKGRIGRIMAIPPTAAMATILHEGSHFLFKFSWNVAPGLTDEYATPPQDNACIMELTWNPLRWCYTDNHLAQASQPVSCWTQIEKDYPNFKYSMTAGPTPPAPLFEYFNGPPGSSSNSEPPPPNSGQPPNALPPQDAFGFPRLPTEGGGSSNGGKEGIGRLLCYVATATYGDTQAEPVQALVTFRDESLSTNAAGSAFVKTYASCAPAPATTIQRHEGLRGLSAALLGVLVPLVGSSGGTLVLCLGVLAIGLALRKRVLG